MISFEEARALANKYISDLEPAVGMQLVLLDDATLERGFGWVFFYNSRAFVETGQVGDCLAGNAPLIVERSTGTLYETGTAHPIEHYIEQFERKPPGDGPSQ